jgi:PBP1b-binding outer membrane lipoprotein LpoB
MKKQIALSLLILVAVISFSCKNTTKKEENTHTKSYSIDSRTTSIKWTAYKTTNKVPVKGEFSTVSIDTLKTGSSAIEVLNNLKFSIPVNSLYTNDTIRDGKLKKFFFGTMENTSNILGEIHMLNETSGNVDITMNGITQSLPITYVIDGQMATIEAVMDLDNWKAQAAITALNTVCAELHAGEDGISKTWSEVKIEVATYLNYK